MTGFLSSGRAVLISLIVALCAVSLAGTVLGWLDPFAQNLDRVTLPPSQDWLLGTDHLGRSLLSRVVAATLPTLGFALIIALSACAIGTILGAACATLSRPFDSIVSRVADAQMALPTLLLAMVVVALLGAGPVSLAIALIAGFWPEFFRVARAVAQREWRKPYVEAAALCGFGRAFILRRYVASEIAPLAMELLPLIAARAVAAVSALGFIGLSVTSPSLDWGLMVADGLPYLREAPHIAMVPAAAIVLAILSLSVLSEGAGVIE